jgi:hypothetical protein
MWSDKWTRSSFLGCFPTDKIPTIIEKYPASLIINLDTHQKPGTHWVAAYIENASTVFYFDSFGPLNCLYPINSKPHPYCMSGPNATIYDFLNRFESVTMNKFIYQSIFADNCAHYCIYFVHAMSIGIPFSKIVNILDKQHDPNSFVTKFVYNIVDRKE